MANPVSLTVWRARLAYRRRRRNHWWTIVEHEKRRSIRSAAQFARWEGLVAEAFAKVDRLRKPAHRALTMFDSVTPANVPHPCVAFAGYVAGNDWPENFKELGERFPHARKLSITLTATAKANVLDVEPGGAMPSEVPGWVEREWAAGVAHPWVYAPLSWWPAINAAIERAEWSRRQRKRIRRWQAHYDGVREIPRGYDAKQYQTGAYDVSVVYADCFP